MQRVAAGLLGLAGVYGISATVVWLMARIGEARIAFELTGSRIWLGAGGVAALFVVVAFLAWRITLSFGSGPRHSPRGEARKEE